MHFYAGRFTWKCSKPDFRGASKVGALTNAEKDSMQLKFTWYQNKRLEHLWWNSNDQIWIMLSEKLRSTLSVTQHAFMMSRKCGCSLRSVCNANSVCPFCIEINAKKSRHQWNDVHLFVANSSSALNAGIMSFRSYTLWFVANKAAKNEDISRKGTWFGGMHWKWCSFIRHLHNHTFSCKLFGRRFDFVLHLMSLIAKEWARECWM